MTATTSNLSAKPRPNMPSAIVALLAWFCALCSVFAILATGYDTWHEWVRSGWPTAEATISRSEVAIYHPFRRNGGPLWHIECRVSFVGDAGSSTATIRSRSSRADSDVERMNAWVSGHGRGSNVEIRYNPGSPSDALFATPDVPLTGSQTGSDIVICAAFAAAFAGGLGLSALLRRAGV